MRIFVLAAGIVSLVSPVWACPPDAETLVSCTLRKGTRQLETCLSERLVTYAFGRQGATPDLSLQRAVTEVEMQPWPGVGSAIWEAFALENKGVVYRIHYGVERAGSTEAPAYGGVTVEQDGKELASFDCDVGSVQTSGYPLPLFEAKEAAGQSYNAETQSWD
jgi:hypothetical protein